MSTHTFVGLEQPSLSAVWSDDFKNQPNGEATLEQKIKFQDGTATMPGGSRIRIDCNPTFDPAITSGKREEAGDAFLPWPKLVVEVYSNGALVAEAELTQESPSKDGLVSLQAPDREDGVYQRSMGYAPILALDAIAYYPSEWHFTMVASDGKESPALMIPKVAGK